MLAYFYTFIRDVGSGKGYLLKCNKVYVGIYQAWVVFALWKRVGLLTPKRYMRKTVQWKGDENPDTPLASSLTLWQTQRQLQSHQGNCLFSLPKSQMLLLGRISSTAWCLGPVIVIQRTVVGHAGMNAIPASHYSVFFFKKGAILN